MGSAGTLRRAPVIMNESREEVRKWSTEWSRVSPFPPLWRWEWRHGVGCCKLNRVSAQLELQFQLHRGSTLAFSLIVTAPILWCQRDYLLFVLWLIKAPPFYISLYFSRIFFFSLVNQNCENFKRVCFKQPQSANFLFFYFLISEIPCDVIRVFLRRKFW